MDEKERELRQQLAAKLEEARSLTNENKLEEARSAADEAKNLRKQIDLFKRFGKQTHLRVPSRLLRKKMIWEKRLT